MRQSKGSGIGWLSILLVLFGYLSAYIPGGTGIAEAAYSQMVSINMQTEQQELGNGKDTSSQRSLARGNTAPVQIASFTQGEMITQFLPAHGPHLLSLQAAAYHAVRRLIYKKPLSELALRTGGHAPP
jgi:hypothetical protein